MKIVFLDIDGVMNSVRSMKEESASRKAGNPRRGRTTSHWFPPYHVQPLNRILDESGAKVVVSSTWRELYPLAEIAHELESQGVRPGLVIDKTPTGAFLPEGFSRTIYGCTPRGAQIAAWLAEHPEVTGFVILDDDADMDQVLPWLVDTDCEAGLTEADADEALRIINLPPYQRLVRARETLEGKP